MSAQPDMCIEDELCRRLGTLLSEARRIPIDERPSPTHAAAALVTAATKAVEVGLTQPGGWGAPWRILTTIAGILPHPDRVAATETIAELGRTPAGHVLAPPPAGPTVAGPVLWTRDRYGSRFGVTAAITTAGRPQRWYLWDIDACGHDAFTVHSGYHPTSQAALGDWQAGVGPTAADGTGLVPVDDPWLLVRLLPAEDGFLRIGGENTQQFAEYHRSRRLAEVVNHAVPLPQTPPVRHGLDATTARTEFAGWLGDSATGRERLPDDLDELIAELADSWCLNDIEPIHTTCSPHRVALCLLHLRSYYEEEFAGELAALLPDWTRWLAARNNTPPELADRCIPYAEGRPYDQITSDDIDPNYLARVTE